MFYEAIKLLLNTVQLEIFDGIDFQNFQRSIQFLKYNSALYVGIDIRILFFENIFKMYK